MMLALKEVWRAKLRFGLLAGAIALLAFLLLFLNTLSAALLGSFTGAIEHLDADVLVYREDARRVLLGSRLDPAVAEDAAGVDGVADAAGLGVAALRADTPEGEADLTLFGFEPGAPGGPGRLVEGRLPGPGEAVVDRLDEAEGFVLGDTIRLQPGGRPLEIVGYTADSRYNVGPTAWVELGEWEAAVRDANPGAPVVPVNAIAVRGDGGEAAALAQRLQAELEGVEALDRQQAVATTPGVSSIRQSFQLISGIGFAAVVLLVGFFFLILTVQKLATLTALRAVGAPIGFLGRSLVVQIVLVVLLAALLATALLALVLRLAPVGLPATLDWSLVGGGVAAVLAASVVAGLLSVRRIARLDPADAVQLR